MSNREKEKGFLRRQWEFAGTFITHPIKTVKNISAGLTEGPVTAGRVVFGASAIFGAAALGVGIWNADPLLSVIGVTFLGLGGSHLNARGAEIRTGRQAELTAETATPPVTEAPEATAAPVIVEDEKTASEKLAAVLGKDEGEGKGGFKPDLARFRKTEAQDSSITGGP